MGSQYRLGLRLTCDHPGCEEETVVDYLWVPSRRAVRSTALWKHTKQRGWTRDDKNVRCPKHSKGKP